MELLEKDIGEAAGRIWEALHENDPMSKTELAKRTGLSNVLLNQGIGWLAREGKLVQEKVKKVEKFTVKK